ncbi:MAG: class I SAM-dependent methyltransferase [bacterium]
MPSCKICSQKTRIIFDRQYEHNYYYCANCEFIFLDESKIISPAQEKKEYSFHHNSLENEGYVQMFRDFINQAIKPSRSGKTTALDFGSGPEPVLAELLRLEGFETDIYDKYFAPEMADQNKKYDLITATEVFEHLADPLSTLKQLKPLLNKNGILALMTLFHQNNDEHFKAWWYRRDATHIAFYTPKTFHCLAALLNMKVKMSDQKNICVLGA